MLFSRNIGMWTKYSLSPKDHRRFCLSSGRETGLLAGKGAGISLQTFLYDYFSQSAV